VKRLIGAIAMSMLLAGCGSGSVDSPPHPQNREQQAASPAKGGETSTAARPAPAPRPRALVTAETENSLAVVDLEGGRAGRVVRRVALPADPEFVAASTRTVVVTSPSSGAVTLLDPSSLRRVKVLHGFGAPHIAEMSPDDRYAYVTDDARGELDVIGLRGARVIARIPVGSEAHHMAMSPDGDRVWIALSESATTIVVVDTSDPAHPKVVGRFDPGFAVHDLRFSPNGRQVWMAPASEDMVRVVDARTRRPLFTVPGGAAPQHVVFDGHHAYVASGYGSRIEAVDAPTGRVLHVADAPYGSFNLDARNGLIAATSLSRGVLTIYDRRLRPQRTVRIAPAARDVALIPAA
jgi:DNA-binding beta-propeller fold protein YncE